MFFKPEHRRKILDKLRSQAPPARSQLANQIAAKVLSLSPFLDGKKVAFYMPDGGEVDTRPIVQSANQLDKTFYLPVLHSNGANELEFYIYTWGDPLHKNKFGISEPFSHSSTPMPTQELDVILVPLVGFDRQCNRLGRGAGYYDRTLAFTKDIPLRKRPILMGLAYDFQKIDKIEPAEWDVPCDMIITEKEIYRR